MKLAEVIAGQHPALGILLCRAEPVSYTHLDVYKRQVWDGLSAGRLAGNVLGLCSGVCYAGVFLFGADKEGDAASSSLFGQLIGAAAGLPLSLIHI